MFRTLLLLLTCSLIACQSSLPDQAVSTAVPFHVVSRSAFFHEKNIEMLVDSMDQTLRVHLQIKQDPRFPFPVVGKDTLYKTAFVLTLYKEGSPLRSEYASLSNTLRWVTDTTHSDELQFVSDTVDLRIPDMITFNIPYYAFHKLSQGRHNITLKVRQETFTGESTRQTEIGTIYTTQTFNKTLLAAEIGLSVNVPVIYKSMIYGRGLELRNDSTFSPAGMDNTILKSSYPDIYWSVLYPAGKKYCQTCYEKSTAVYQGKDTFALYHYKPADSLEIAVYDHDNLSYDDGLGVWRGTISNLEGKTGKRLSFGFVRQFDLQVTTPLRVN